MLKSKRFLTTIAAGIIFIAGVFFFHAKAIDLATGISVILAPYLAAETFNPSNQNSNVAPK
jgi:hypothetical protein